MKVSEMYIDYATCMSQKEMERKYELSYSTISRRCKRITEILFAADHGILFQQVDKIKAEVDRIAEEEIKCPQCGSPHFWE